MLKKKIQRRNFLLKSRNPILCTVQHQYYSFRTHRAMRQAMLLAGVERKWNCARALLSKSIELVEMFSNIVWNNVTDGMSRLSKEQHKNRDQRKYTCAPSYREISKPK